MNRPLVLLPLGLLLGALAYGAGFWLQTREERARHREPHAELAWLRREFNLTDDQYRRVVALHEAYRPTCLELCRRIAEQNARLTTAALATNRLTAGVQQLVLETGRVRDDCRQAMLGHLYTVAAELPPEAAGKYLRLMLEATCVIEDAHPLDDAEPATSPPPEGHRH